jgi:hypothetical protein
MSVSVMYEFTRTPRHVYLCAVRARRLGRTDDSQVRGTRIHTCMHTYIHTHAYTCIYTHIHTRCQDGAHLACTLVPHDYCACLCARNNNTLGMKHEIKHSTVALALHTENEKLEKIMACMYMRVQGSIVPKCNSKGKWGQARHYGLGTAHTNGAMLSLARLSIDSYVRQSRQFWAPRKCSLRGFARHTGTPIFRTPSPLHSPSNKPQKSTNFAYQYKDF